MNGLIIPRGVKIALAIVLALLLLLFIGWVVRKLRKPPNAAYLEGGGALPPGWSPKKYADRMFEVIDGVFTSANTKAEAAKELTELNDNQLIDVYNYWNDEYSTKTSLGEKFGTLPNAMKKELNVPNITILGTNYWKELENRFERLQLT